MEKLFENTQTLTLFLFFFLPGFVSLKVYDSLVPSERRDFSKSIYEVVAYSTLNYALLYPLVAWVLSRSTSAHPILIWVGGAFVLVAFPRSLALLMDSRPQKPALFETLCPPDTEALGFRFWPTQPVLDYRPPEGPAENRRCLRRALVCFIQPRSSPDLS